MRKDLHEPGCGVLKLATAADRAATRAISEGARLGALNPPAVDEALADDATLAETTPMIAQRGSRRELTGSAAEIDRRILDYPHAAGNALPISASGDGALLRQLSQQLTSLQAQQDQIRRLLEQAERHAAAK